MQADILEVATLEIMRYVPPALLPNKEIGELDFDELAWLLARARYLQKVERYNMAQAIADVFAK